MSEGSRAAGRLTGAPPLAGVATLSAFADFAVTRLAVRLAAAGESPADHDLLVRLATVGELLRNLAALAGLVALLSIVLDFLRPERPLPLSQRLGVAGFAGVFLPTVLLATVLPVARTTPQVVVFALAAAHLMVALLGMTAFRHGARRALRIGLIALAFASIAALSAGILQLLAPVLGWAFPVSQAFRRAGEVTWLLSLGALAWMAVPAQLPVGRRALALGLGTLAGAVPLALALALRPRDAGSAYEDVLYGATHLELLLGRTPTLYLTLLAFALAGAFAGLFSPAPARRELALGVIAVAAGGYAPSTPSTLLMMVVGAGLITRAYLNASYGPSPAREASLLEVARELEDEP